MSTTRKWIATTDRLPRSGETVLAYYLDQQGMGRIIRACWVAAKSEESHAESLIGEYDETSDTYYDPEGWYEQMDNWDDYNRAVVHQGDVTHWMPMPMPPHSEPA